MSPGSVADATGNWVDTLAPAWSRPYLRLARLDRPIGSWLLLLPCWWSSALAAVAAHARAPSLLHIVLFFVGAFAMRGAGCTWNDIVDRDLDGSVERTRSRPIPSGQVSVRQAAVFLVLQSLVGLAVLLTFNGFTVALGIASLADRRGVSVHEAHYLLAADRARPGVLVGRADGLGRRVRPARSGAAAALRRLDLLGDRLRHDLCPPGSRGRRADRHQIDRAFVRGANQADAGAVLRARRHPDRRSRRGRRRRHRLCARACWHLPPTSAGKSPASIFATRTTASRCSNPTAMPV